jgi:T5SS/PEP-CTERM-associated repeat protein
VALHFHPISHGTANHHQLRMPPAVTLRQVYGRVPSASVNCDLELRRSANRGIGSVTIDGSGSIWSSSSALYVGPNTGVPTDLSGRGELNVVHGGTVTTAADGFIDVTSSASVDGAGSRWSVGGNLNVNGALSITNGALVTSKNGTIDATFGPAQVTISGPGAKWAATGDVLINSGTLSLSDGGELAATGSITNFSNIQGNGTITGNVTNYGVVMPNGSPGRLTIAGNFAQGLGSYGTVQIELGGTQAGINYDQLVVTGTASLGDC